MRIMRDGVWGDEADPVIVPTNGNYQVPDPVDVVPARTKKIIKKSLADNLEVEKRKKQK